jgi:pilus assembly protein CpaF
MAMMADIELPLAALRPQIASAVDIVIQGTRYRDGSRKITHISEICGFDSDRGKYTINDLFIRNMKGVDSRGRIESELVPTGNLPSQIEHIEASGFDLPVAVREAAWRKKSKGQA